MIECAWYRVSGRLYHDGRDRFGHSVYGCVLVICGRIAAFDTGIPIEFGATWVDAEKHLRELQLEIEILTGKLFRLLYTTEEGAFRGFVVVRAATLMDAMRESVRRGLSPGGLVESIEIRPEDEHRVPENCRNRRLTKEEADALK